MDAERIRNYLERWNLQEYFENFQGIYMKFFFYSYKNKKEYVIINE